MIGRPRRLLLYVSSAGASFAFQDGQALREVRALAADAEGWEQLNRLILAHPRVPLSIVVDSVEELYRSEALPRAWGRDRRDMLGRRLRQALHQTPYRAVLRQGPADPGQVGRRYLFMGLTAPEILRPWLDVIRLRGAPLAGIWLAPLLSRTLLGRFGLASPKLLLVSEQTGGLRLSYFEAGQLRFSRLAPVDSALYDNPLEGYGEEIERTRQFLLSQRLLTREEILPTCLVDPLDTLDELRAILPASAGFRCETIPRGRILSELRLPPGLLSESSDALFLALLGDAPGEANLLPEELRRAYRHFRLRRWLYAGGAVCLGATTLVSLAFLADAWRHDHAARAYREQTVQARQQATDMLAKAGDAVRFAQVEAAVGAWRRVADGVADPAAALDGVLAVCHARPGIRVTRLDWTGRRPGTGETVLADAEVLPFQGDYQAAHQAVREVAAALESAGWRVVVERWPADPASNRDLRGEFGRGQGNLLATFQLRLVREGRP